MQDEFWVNILYCTSCVTVFKHLKQVGNIRKTLEMNNICIFIDSGFFSEGQRGDDVFLIGTKNILETFSKQSVCSVSLKTRLTGKA